MSESKPPQYQQGTYISERISDSHYIYIYIVIIIVILLLLYIYMYVCAQMYLSMIRIDMRKRIRRGNGWNPVDSHVDLQGETVKEDRTYSKNTCL